MKYIVFGPHSYISDRILTILASVYKSMNGYAIRGLDNMSTIDLINLKNIIKNDNNDVYLISTFAGNLLPAFNAVPPSDFSYQLAYLQYNLHDYILYKTIETMPKNILSVQSINNFILNNNNMVQKWKEQYDLFTNVGEYDLSFAQRIDILKCIENPSKYLGSIFSISAESLNYAIKENSTETNPNYTNRYNIPEHYYQPLTNTTLSNITLEHILKL